MFKPQTKGFLNFLVGSLAFTIWSATAEAQQPAFTQRFQSEGPGPEIGPADNIGTRDFAASNQGSTSGAVQAILPSFTDPNTMFIGGVNGGVWVTKNAGQSWTPLTDNLSSLSITSLSFNTTNSQTIYAGIGLTSNGAVGVPDDITARGGSRDGIILSTDGGTTWSTMSSSITSPLLGKSVIAVLGSGTTVFAATAEPHDASQRGAQGYGLYVSTGGSAFTLVTGVPSGAATALVGAGTNTNPYYVSINPDTGSGAVYRSTDGGTTWTSATTIATGQIGRLATAPNGAVAVATYNTDGSLATLRLSQNGTQWVDLPLPPITTGKQLATNLALAIDPNNTNIVYIAGDTRSSPPYTATAYRVYATAPSDGSAQIQTITDSGTADNSTAHADSRNFAFDASGRLILVGDGGVYARTAPSSATGTWTGLNNSLALRESYGVAYDAVSKRLIVAAQDNGVAMQTLARGQTFSPLMSADGTVAVVNDRTYATSGESLHYFAVQNLAFLTRNIVNSSGVVVRSDRLLDSAKPGDPIWNFLSTDFTAGGGDPDSDGGTSTALELPFSTRFVLNRNDPTRIAIGARHIYVTTDSLVTNQSGAILTNVGDATVIGNSVTALAYGTNNNVNALLAGVDVDSGTRLYYSATGATGSLTALTAYTGGGPTSVVFDPRSDSRFYVTDRTSLFSSNNTGANFADITSNLTTLGISRPSSVEFISNNGVNALLVGGSVSSTLSLSPIAVAMSDGAGVLSGWSSFGRGLPNTNVNLLTYNSTADVLAVSLFGRGIWTLYDVTSYFATASVLQYGLADNDSTPDASFLTGNRPLIKYGAGTLTISAGASYTGTTTVNDGTLLANASLASSSGLTIEAPATVRGTGILPTTTVNGRLAPGNNAVGTLTVQNGLTFNAGSFYQVAATAVAASTTSVTGGAASVAGTLEVQLQPGSYRPSRSYNVLTATGGVTGSFAGATTNMPFLRPSLSYDGNDVFLTIAPGGFAHGAQTAGQASVGAVLDHSAATASGDFGAVIDAFGNLTAAQAPAAFDAISGQPTANAGTVGVQTGAAFLNTIGNQVGTIHGGSNGGQRVAMALKDGADACDITCDASPTVIGTWLSGVGGFGAIPGGNAAGTASYSFGGTSVGADYRFSPNFLAGVSVGYVSGTSSVSGFNGRSTSDTFNGTIYGSYSDGPFYLDGLAGYATADNHTTRYIVIPGLDARIAQGRTSADQFLGQLETGYRFDVATLTPLSLTPFARLQGSTNTQDAFTETGANSLNLTIGKQTTNSLRTTFGLDVGTAVEKVDFGFRLGWIHEYADTARPMTATLAGVPGTPFTVFGATPQRDTAALGFSAKSHIAESTELYARYDGEVGGGTSNHALTAGLRMTW